MLNPQGSVDQPDWRTYNRFKKEKRSTPSGLHEIQISWEHLEKFGTTFGALYCLVVFIWLTAKCLKYSCGRCNENCILIRNLNRPASADADRESAHEQEALHVQETVRVHESIHVQETARVHESVHVQPRTSNPSTLPEPIEQTMECPPRYNDVVMDVEDTSPEPIEHTVECLPRYSDVVIDVENASPAPPSYYNVVNSNI